MKTFPAPVLAAFASGAMGITDLLALEFTGTPVYLNASNWSIPFGGNLYKGAAGLGQISVIDEQPGQVVGLSFSMSGTSSAMLSLAMDGAGTVKGAPATLRTGLFSVAADGSLTLLNAPILWAGKLDTMSISLNGNTRTVSATAEGKGINLMRSVARYYSDADQRLINSSDGAFSFVADQIGKPVVWPSRAWFQHNK